MSVTAPNVDRDPDHQLSVGGVVLGAIASELANTVIPALVGAEPEVLR